MNKFNKELVQMKKENKPLNEYLKILVNLNAKERLQIMTKNADMPLDKSSNWKFIPNLDDIILNEKKYSDFNANLNQKKFEFTPIDSKYYYPKFIKEMNDQQLKDFSNTLNDKIKKVKLNMAKIQLNSERYKVYEKEEKNKTRKINIKDEMKRLFGKSIEKKEITSPRLEKLKAERAYKFGIIKTYKNIDERFDNYKNDFNMRLNDLENEFENKLLNKSKDSSNYSNSKNKNRNTMNTYHIKKILEEYKIKKTNKSILPSITNTRSIIKIDNNEIIGSKKKFDFNFKNKAALTVRNSLNNSFE